MSFYRTFITVLPIAIGGCTTSPYVGHDSPPIIQVAQRGQMQQVRDIVKHDASALNHTDSNGHSAAHCAILNDYHEIAIYLIENGFSINPTTEHGFPLIMACVSRNSQGSRDMLKYLLENGADPNVVYDSEGWIPLNMAANNGQEKCVRLLIEYGAELDSRDENGQTSLEMAKERVAYLKDQNFNFPHGELSDPKVRSAAVDRWRKMVILLEELKESR